MKSFGAHGKLLLTGEYLVLHGAVALALPTKLGQTLTVAVTEEPSLQWSAYQPDGRWFSATLDTKSLDIIATDDPLKASKLSQILTAVRDLNPQAFQPGLRFETHLDFNPEWGLGSSSTLISTLAQWAGVDPYQLLKKTFGGSGYDIACAQSDAPIHYQLGPNGCQVRKVAFNPPFADRLFFVYQGHKQSSSAEVARFDHQHSPDFVAELQTISELSVALPTITYFDDFQTLLQVHEQILSRCLDRSPIQQRFPDFKGTLKSLGAWGGDFMLAATDLPYDEIRDYFKNKGLTTVFHYQDLI